MKGPEDYVAPQVICTLGSIALASTSSLLLPAYTCFQNTLPHAIHAAPCLLQCLLNALSDMTHPARVTQLCEAMAAKDSQSQESHLVWKQGITSWTCLGLVETFAKTYLAALVVFRSYKDRTCRSTLMVQETEI